MEAKLQLATRLVENQPPVLPLIKGMKQEMYDEFDKLISLFSIEDSPSEYWYDSASEEAESLLKKFSDTDWDLLLKNLHFKPLFWKKRLIECLGYIHNNYEINIILQLLIENDDRDLFLDCADVLRSLDLSWLNHSQRQILLSNINYLVKNNKEPIKRVLEDLINKIKFLS